MERSGIITTVVVVILVILAFVGIVSLFDLNL